MKMTDETFKKQFIKRKEFIHKLTNGEYKLLEYISCFENARILHLKCNKINEIPFSSFSKIAFCRICKSDKPKRARQVSKHTFETVKEVVEESGEFELISFNKPKAPIKVKHIECQSTIEINYYSFIKSFNCRNCLRKSQYGEERFIRLYASKIEERNYTYMGGYIDSNTKILMNCNECSSPPYYIYPGNFINNGVDCECRGRQSGKNQYVTGDTKEEVEKASLAHLKQKFYALDLSRDFSVDWSTYKTAKSRILVTHLPCGNVYNKSASHIVRGSCSKCSGRYQFTSAEYKKFVKDRTKGLYECLGEYSKNGVKLIHKHNKCGKEWLIAPSKFKNGSRCPSCSIRRSLGAKRVDKYLISLKLNYVTEFRINECRNKSTLPFDFAILNKENNLIGLIEFDGRQHFYPISKFGGEKGLKETQINDRIKDNFCKENNIELLRIKYTEYDEIEDKIDDFLEIRLKHLLEFNS